MTEIMNELIISKHELAELNMDKVAETIFYILKFTKFKVSGQLKLEIKKRE